MKAKFQIGDKVAVRVPTDAYYSNYGGNPTVIIQPGQVGIVGAVDVPCVRGKEGSTFICVDFVLPGVFAGNPKCNNCQWRIGTPASNLISVSKN